MTPRTLWTIEDCPACSGGGMAYCEKCERACEHDRECPTCHGSGLAPRRLEPGELLAAMFLDGQYYPSRAAALLACREEK